MLKVYVAGAHRLAPAVRALHGRLRALGCTPVSTWAETAIDDGEDLDAMTDAEAKAHWHANHTAIMNADVVIVLADSGGRETFTEVASAMQGRPLVLWIGSETLTARAFRAEIARANNVDHALDIVAGIVAEGRRIVSVPPLTWSEKVVAAFNAIAKHDTLPAPPETVQPTPDALGSMLASHGGVQAVATMSLDGEISMAKPAISSGALERNGGVADRLAEKGESK